MLEILRKKYLYPIIIIVLLFLNIYVGFQLYKIYKQEEKSPKNVLEKEFYFYLEEVKSNPRNIDARIGLAMALIELKRYEEAAKELEKAKKINKNYGRIYYAYGLLESKRGNFSKAEAEFKKAIKLDPADVLSRIELSKIYIDSKRFDDAIQNLEEAKSIFPMAADIYYYLGICYRNIGDTKKARENLLHALKLSPDFKEAKEELEKLQKQ